MAQRFTFGNACLHFANAEGPRGFIWKYAMSYLLAAILMACIGYLIFRPVFTVWYDIMLEVVGGASETEIERIVTRRLTQVVGRVVLGVIAMISLFVMMWAVFEAAVQRRYVREEGFSLRLGSDEFRLMAIGLMWGVFYFITSFLALILGAFVTGLVVGITDEAAVIGIAAFIGFGAAGLLWSYFAVRLAPAAAMTIRDGSITFFRGWGATSGRFWKLLLSYILLALAFWLVSSIVSSVFGMTLVASIMSQIPRIEQFENNPAELLNILFGFNILAPIMVSVAATIIMHGLFAYVWSGPAALAAKTDPRGGGVAQAPDVFL